MQASEKGAVVIVDDPWGRELASRYGLEFHGTFWILQRFFELELLSSPELRGCLESLRKRGTRLPWEAVNTFLTQLGERSIEP